MRFYTLPRCDGLLLQCCSLLFPHDPSQNMDAQITLWLSKASVSPSNQHLQVITSLHIPLPTSSTSLSASCSPPRILTSRSIFHIDFLSRRHPNLLCRILLLSFSKVSNITDATSIIAGFIVTFHSVHLLDLYPFDHSNGDAHPLGTCWRTDKSMA